MRYPHGKLVKFLCLLGAILGILQVILIILRVVEQPYLAHFSRLPYPAGEIIFGILCIFVCIVLLASFDVINIKLRIVPSWLVILVLGILIVLLGGLWGGVLVVIGALIATVDAL